MKKIIKKILIANRGEIAIRIMRSCRKLNIETIGVYSRVDSNMMHVSYADKAYLINENSGKDAYLNIEEIVEIALKEKVDAVHPGYGFLSENSLFLKKLKEKDISFIGPDFNTIDVMGSKTKAREFVKKIGVNVVPGVSTIIQSIDDLEKIQKEIDYPIMLKASAGGGGKGMRKVSKEEDLRSSYFLAQNEALNYFKDKSIYIEKFVENPRHIEIQIIGDKYGNYAYFKERECSVQRRHQKIIEETPSVFINEKIRKKMGKTACLISRSIGYIGVGTIEYLVDKHQNYYFMEMNTRLQVEHGITEMITGEDLVSWQIRIERGENIDWNNQEVLSRGCAIEGRVCAEDPLNNFIPTPGIIEKILLPNGPFVRTDTSQYDGSIIPIEYDSMIGKIMAWGKNREEAIQRLNTALSETLIKGCINNIEYLRVVLNSKIFLSGVYDTSILDKILDKELDKENNIEIALIGTIISYIKNEEKLIKKINKRDNEMANLSRWRQSINNLRN